jgi:hypothetical protein
MNRLKTLLITTALIIGSSALASAKEHHQDRWNYQDRDNNRDHYRYVYGNDRDNWRGDRDDHWNGDRDDRWRDRDRRRDVDERRWRDRDDNRRWNYGWFGHDRDDDRR